MVLKAIKYHQQLKNDAEIGFVQHIAFIFNMLFTC